MTTPPGAPVGTPARRAWAQALVGVVIGLAGQVVSYGVGLATAFIAAWLHPSWGLEAFTPALYAMVITEGLLFIAALGVGIRLIRRGRRPLGIALLSIPSLAALTMALVRVWQLATD